MFQNGHHAIVEIEKGEITRGPSESYRFLLIFNGWLDQSKLPDIHVILLTICVLIQLSINDASLTQKAWTEKSAI